MFLSQNITERANMANSITKNKKDHILFMTKAAALKLGAYAKIAGHDEFMVILLGKKTLKNVVVDIFLLYDQKIGPASVDVSGHGINKSMWEIQEKYPESRWEILGWAHGHGNGPVFHSYTDDNNTEKIFLDQLAPVRLQQRNLVTQDEMIANAQHQYTLSVDHGGFLRFLNLNSEELPEKIKVEKHFPFYVGWVYSLVTNARHEYYAERFNKKWCIGCDSISITRSRLKVKVLPAKQISKPDMNALQAEFKMKTKCSFHLYMPNYVQPTISNKVIVNNGQIA